QDKGLYQLLAHKGPISSDDDTAASSKRSAITVIQISRTRDSHVYAHVVDDLDNNSEQLDMSEIYTVHYVMGRDDNSNSDNVIQEHVSYPMDRDSADIWMLPSGSFAQNVVQTPPTDAHRYHPSRFGIVRLGENVRRPQSVGLNDWAYLQHSYNIPYNPMSNNCNKLLTLFVQVIPTDIKYNP
ncbi:hypothetical protein BC936DRAFT_147085, partial [Jimgerdemannia flammicorona]